ncbi:MAG: CPBP family intramembrane metalloprotease [Candidatus Eisenbacteria bacterium]|uniref:CPBP family intramembrane metalloprotease n=1 Tax=Eiseniibacteriota bacterium TaxID=2212470 RepID=A0A7Y2E8M2_UNCEI|nr:CPBP family intramembrane metalloprotease [Candidatus Eisenbacteria bacterium]
MELTILDHLFVLLIAVLFPIYATVSYRRGIKKLRENPESKVGEYKFIILIQWTFVLMLAGIWAYTSRGIFDLGLNAPAAGWKLYVSISAVVALVALQIVQIKSVRSNGEERKKLREQAESVAEILPSNDYEQRWFNMLSLTAGICEEILYRGFFMTYLATFIGLWPAVFVQALQFGLAHSYQGAPGILRTGLVGLAMGLVFAITGSLWAPILLHIILDVTSGMIVRNAFDDLSLNGAETA